MDRRLRDAKRGLEAAGYEVAGVENRARHRFVVIIDASGRRAFVYLGCMSGRNTNSSTWARLAREAFAHSSKGPSP